MKHCTGGEVPQLTYPKPFDPSQPLRALSWKQPYAELMFQGKIETRTWPTKYRGWVLICTSLKRYTLEEVRDISGEKQAARIANRNTYQPFEGKAIAIAKLVDCRPMVKEDEGKCFVAFNPALFCHVYERVIPIEPFPWKGSQGWKEVSAEIKNQIRQL